MRDSRFNALTEKADGIAPDDIWVVLMQAPVFQAFELESVRKMESLAETIKIEKARPGSQSVATPEIIVQHLESNYKITGLLPNQA